MLTLRESNAPPTGPAITSLPASTYVNVGSTVSIAAVDTGRRPSMSQEMAKRAAREPEKFVRAAAPGAE